MAGMMEGKAGIVTGAGSGIGRASAITLAAEGASVIVADIAQDSGHETVEQILDTGGRAIFMRCDVAQQEDIRALVDRSLAEYGRLDFAHNNAAIQAPQVPITEMEFADWTRVFGVNVDAIFWSIKYQLPAMARTGGGAIVNTASTGALRAFPKNAPYAASKCAVIHLTKCAAKEAGPFNVRVNAICPGMTRTPMLQKWIDEVPERASQIEAAIPLGRMAEPEDQANAVLWLCSDRSAYISGVAIPVDGGEVA